MGAEDHFRGKSVLITGASSGIGEELARQLARAGAVLTLAARRTAVLKQLADSLTGPAPVVCACDVTQDAAVAQAVTRALERWGKLDIVIANAGFGVVGPFAQLSLEDFRRQFETNVFGVLRTLKYALPEVKRARGQLVIIGSVAGWCATPGTSPYAMSKFALRALAGAITPELASEGVSVTLVSPGFVESDIRRVDNQGALHAQAREPIPAWLLMRRDRAVRQMLRAIARRQREVIITTHGKLFVLLERFFPWIIRAAGRRMAAGSRGSYRGEAGS